MDEWAVDLPGSPSVVPAARRWVRDILADLPGIDADLIYDATLVASELVTNSVRHSVAGDGGAIRLAIRRDGDLIRVEVADGGARSGPEPGWTGAEARDYGRGLRIVAETTTAMGDESTAEGGRLAWAELKA
jgi:serine/threonine-protein kinase RsbW